MNILAPSLALALALQASPPPAGTQDAQAVLAAVLAQEAAVRGPEGGAQTCVAGALAGPPVPPGGETAMALDRAVRIYFEWHAPAPPAVVRPPPPPDGPGRQRRRRIEPIPAPPPLAPALAERLSALRAEAAAAPAPAGAGRIDAATVPAPLHLQRPDDDCALLTLSRPAFAGDAAFVELAYVCGTVCGQGNLYALERRDGRWQVVGVADTWIR
ncbi:MAG TPA: hypothetical protein VGW40_14170 [Allosphingosinicella sp.]|nr:hypothetical protein [Allosphingosinicella sp.]